jgi:hypothetical protein
MIADPLKSIATPFVSKNVETGFKPIGETMRNLNRFVFRMIRGQNAILNRLAAIDREIAVQFEHGVMWLDLIVAVDLDLIVVLRASRQGPHGERRQTDWDRRCKPQSHGFLKAPQISSVS